jgi:uracil-DNA glycosylase
MNQTQSLSQLRKSIIEELCVKQWLDVWFFPELDGVKGWSGAAHIMFVGLNPSTGTFPSKAGVMFYDSLRKNDLSDAHITDLYKIRMKGKLVHKILTSPELEKLHRAWLKEEVRLLEPHVIVALGHQTFGILKNWLPELSSRIVKIHHYAWAQRYGRSEVFADDVTTIRDRYRASTR